MEKSKIEQENRKLCQQLYEAKLKLKDFTKHSVYWIHKAQKAEKKLADTKSNLENFKRRNSTIINEVIEGKATSSKMQKQSLYENSK